MAKASGGKVETGGVAIDRLAREGDAKAIRFPKAIVKGADLDFSFSGLKTALLHHVKKHGLPGGRGLADLCASYQEAIVRALVEKVFRAARRLQFERVVVSGGVAANSRLRAAVTERAGEYEGMRVFLPAPRLCTDNAAMIAVAGTHALLRGERAGPELAADPAWRLGAPAPPTRAPARSSPSTGCARRRAGARTSSGTRGSSTTSPGWPPRARGIRWWSSAPGSAT